MKKRIVILGAGISGLTTAYWLNKENYDITILEKKDAVGGSMESVLVNGMLFDRGPNSGLETTPIVKQLVEELDLKEKFLYATKKGNKRYILRDGVLHPLPMSGKAFISTKLFSAGAKLRLFAEPFIGRSKDGYYQSIAQFVQRRLGKEFLDYAINPFVAGVYAGKPEELSVKSAFPKLYALEEKYGGLIVGTVRSIRERKKRKEIAKQSAKMFSFTEGMQALPMAIHKRMKENIILNAAATSVRKEENGYLVNYMENGESKSITADAVLSSIQAFELSEVIRDYDGVLSNRLNSIYHPPVMVLFLTYKVADIPVPLDGFGFLIPANENRSFLGALWNSVIFEDRTPPDTASFTLFVGGSRNADIFTSPVEEIIPKVISEFNEIMKIKTKPDLVDHRFWQKSIPQYNLGYIEHENYFDKFEELNKGLFLSGNFRGGISVGDCIKNSEIVCEKVKNYLNEN